MDYIPDYTEQYNDYLDRLDDIIDHLPRCKCCGDAIYDEELEDGGICAACLEEIRKEENSED